MQNRYWISGILVLGIGAGMVGMASANQGKHGPRGFGDVKFETLDLNSDGKISPDELSAQKDARFKLADTNGDGMLSVEEMQAQSRMRSEKRIKRMLEHRDSNADGMLSMQELAKGRDGSKFFKRFDKDGDGSISAEEFAKLKGKWAKRGHGKPASE